MRLALLLVSALVACVLPARAQERTGYEYYISDEVHATLAERIERERLGRPERQFYLEMTGYGGDEWGLGLHEYPGACDTVRVATAGRFITLGGDRYKVISDVDNWFGVHEWMPDPFDPEGPLRPLSSSCLYHGTYTVRFDIRRQITGIENERTPKEKPWNRRDFLHAAVEVMVEDLDWDTVWNSELDYYASPARTLDGAVVIAAVLDDRDVLADVLADAEALRAERPEWMSAPLWLYAPPWLDVGETEAVVRRVPFVR